MKVSLQTIKELTTIDAQIEELTTKIGAQLGEIDDVADLSLKYQGTVIASIVRCDKHSDADKLSVCWIDDGGKVQDVARNENGHVQVVCGAPNVREGLLVAWLPPGTAVPSTITEKYLQHLSLDVDQGNNENRASRTDEYGERDSQADDAEMRQEHAGDTGLASMQSDATVVLEPKELRGVVSNGMLASAQELDISDNHEGIIELDHGNPGDDFAESYGLNDTIIDIENKMFTHRPDCFGQLGVAREIAGILHQPFTSPDWYKVGEIKDESLKIKEGAGLALEVENQIPELVPRFSAVTLSDVEVKPSPLWLQIALLKFGTKSINNIVDVTNFVMHLTGQPIHAYDYDKVANKSSENGAKLIVRHPNPEESVALLNSKVITPRSEAIMIATDSELIGIGGVMGGSSTEVDSNTKNIIIEVANFDMYNIRRTSMEHGLFTEAVTRFNKGQSPLQTAQVLHKTVTELLDVAGGSIASPIIDDNHLSDEQNSNNRLYPPLRISAEFINDRLGLELSEQAITTLLSSVEFTVDHEDQELVVTAPMWRTDIEIAEDIVEEVGRLYGYDQLPRELPRRHAVPAAKDALIVFKQKLRDLLSAAGANELLSYNFVHSKLLTAAGQDKALAYTIKNALSPDLQNYRLSLLPSLLEKIPAKVREGSKQYAVFELNKSHIVGDLTEENVPKEYNQLAFVFVSDSDANAYYDAKKYLEYICSGLGVSVSIEKIDHDQQQEINRQVWAPFEPKQSAVATTDDELLGFVGVPHAQLKRALKLPDNTAMFELNIDALREHAVGSRYTQLSKYPSVSQDITLEVDGSVIYSSIVKVIESIVPIGSVEVYLEILDIYQPEDSDQLRYSFRITASSDSRTLTSAEVTSLLGEISSKAAEQLSAKTI